MTNHPRGVNVGGDYIDGGIKQTGDHNKATMKTRSGAPTDDLEAMLKFVEAASRNLDLIELSDQERDAAFAVIRDLRAAERAEHPDPSRLRSLARSLRTILEGAAGNGLADGVLRLWGS